MDIRVGDVARASSLAERIALAHSAIEAKVLSVRSPRRRNQGPPGGRGNQRRNTSPVQDPPGARVLLLMVLDGSLLPADVESGGYRVFIRFAKR
jgi:hypothetical protein